MFKMRKNLKCVMGVLAIGMVFMSSSCDKMKDVNTPTEKTTKVERDSTATGLQVAYYSVDSLNANYQLVKDVTADIEVKVKAETSKFEAEVKSFENWAVGMEKKMRNQELSQNEQEQFAQQYQKRQMELAQKEQDIAARIEEMQITELTRATNRVNAFVKEYALKNGYDMVFQYQIGGQIIYINEAFDATEDIINGLNEEYKTTAEELNK
jgi:outer membrane protein